MDAGLLNCRVTVRQRSTGSDELGQPLESWADVCTVWAEIRHPSGVELIKAGAEVSVVRASIKVRQRPGITAAMQAVHGARVYDIEAVLPDEVDRLHMFLVCKVTT